MRKSPKESNMSIFYRLMEEYSDQTVIHGFRYIFKSTNIFWRALWIVMFLGAWSAFTWQVYERTKKYYSRPVNIDIEVEYRHPVIFPVVTICNSNSFRISKAEELGLWKNITEYYTMEESKRENSTLLDYIGIETLKDLSHMKEDMIKSCKWVGHKCGPENFTEIMTDQGLCYSFNYNQDSLVVHDTGLSNGLQLLLNIEHYEYMAGPHQSAAIKLLTHSPQEVPRVRDLGITVAQKSDVKVGLQMQQVTNLPKPYGDCGQKAPSFGFPVYSNEICMAICSYVKVVEKCGCRATWMKWHVGKTMRYCNMSTQHTCVENVLRDLEKTKQCKVVDDCPRVCTENSYNIDVSYTARAAFSNKNLAKVWQNDTQMLYKYKRASLIFHRYDDDTNYENNRSIRKTIKEIESINAFYQTAKQGLNDLFSILEEGVVTEVEKKLAEVIEDIKKRRENFEQCLVADFPFILLRSAMSQVHLSMRIPAIEGFTTLSNSTDLDTQLGKSERKKVSRYLNSVDASFRSFQGACEIMSAVVKQTIVHFENLTTAELNCDILPLDLMRERGVETLTHLTHFSEELRKISALLEPVVMEDNEVLSAVSDLKIRHISMIGNYLKDHFVTVKRRTQDLIDESESLNYLFRRMRYAIEREKNLYTEFYSMFKLRGRLVINAADHINAYGTKLDIAKPMVTDIKSLTSYITAKNSTILDLLNALNELHDGPVKSFTQVFEEVTRDVTTLELSIKDFVLEVNITSSLIAGMKNPKNVELIRLVQNLLTRVKNLSDTSEQRKRNVKEAWTKFLTVFSHFRDRLKMMKDTLQIDGHFISTNFIRVWVYFQRLTYQVIRRQEGYKWFALISDIGGAAGLFLGASILVIPEFIYFFVRKASEQSRLNKLKPNEENDEAKVSHIEVQSTTMRTPIGCSVNENQNGQRALERPRVDALWQIP